MRIGQVQRIDSNNITHLLNILLFHNSELHIGNYNQINELQEYHVHRLKIVFVQSNRD